MKSVRSNESWNGPQPLVTIGIPTVERFEYLQEAVASAAGQHYPRVEILVANDAWHSRLNVDPSCGTPWHGLVRDHLHAERDLSCTRVLDIGCGRGDFSCWLAAQPIRPATIVAADFSIAELRKGREFASRLGLRGITWGQQDVQAIAHPDGSFDTVIWCETIEHVSDPRRALHELARVLKPGGRLFVATPNYFGVLGLYRIYLRLCGRRFTEEGQPINNVMQLPLTRSWLAQTGLRVAAIDGTGHYLLWPGRQPREIKCLNKPRVVMRWLALHSLVVVEK